MLESENWPIFSNFLTPEAIQAMTARSCENASFRNRNPRADKRLFFRWHLDERGHSAVDEMPKLQLIWVSKEMRRSIELVSTHANFIPLTLNLKKHLNK